MASIAVTFTHPSQSATKTVNLPDVHLARIFAAFKSFYMRTEGLPDTITNAQVFDKLFAEFATSLRNRVAYEDRLAAEEAAVAAITPIGI